jgi:protein ImuB
MVWLGLWVPDLPLEIHSRGLESPGPLALWELQGRERRILLVNAPAAARGVAPGQTPAAALALAADLRLLPRRPPAEQAALEGIALWALGFSSEVSLAPPTALVLEIGRSLRLFGGEASLLRQLLAGLEGLGYRAHWGLAPQPAAALLLAHQGGGVARDPAALRAALGRMSFQGLGLAPAILETLGRMGLRTLGELLRLPRAGLAQRCGPELVLLLERLLGQAPDPRPQFVPPPRFQGRLELPAEVAAAPALAFAAQRLLRELGGFLQGRGAGVQRLDWELIPAEGPPSRLVLGLLQPSRDPLYLGELLRERLDQHRLARPVREIRLQAEQLLPLAPQPRELFPQARGQGEEGERLLERLQARLGREVLTGLEARADHRPERAWGWCEPGQGAPPPLLRRGTVCPGRRPLWLLPEPLPLEVAEGRPRYRGERLALGRERERIEAGWWDGGGIGRDYFVAATAAGEQLWVFRELGGAGRWFLQGFFG